MALTPEDIAKLQQEIGPDRYRVYVVDLFQSGRATPTHWAALTQAILHVSESTDGDLVESIDRAVLDAHRDS